MSTRRIIATYAFVMFFLVIALLGTVTAAFGGTSYTEAAGRQSLYTLTAAKARGTIYDRNLQPLTNAERVYCRCGNSLAGNACQIKPRCTGRKTRSPAHGA